MHSLIKFSIFFTFIFTVNLIANDEKLFSCLLAGEKATYHENEAKRLESIGAECHPLSYYEYVTCSMDGVRMQYSRDEAEKILSSYPKAVCDINNILYTYSSYSSNKPMHIKRKLVIYFSVNSTHLSKSDYQKILNYIQNQYQDEDFITITGYASATGSNAHNHILSLKRATIVKNTLIKNGISSNAILSVDAMGEESLRYNTQHEYKYNRAVEIRAYGY